MIPDGSAGTAQPYTPSPAEVEANNRYQRQRSIEFALATSGGAPMSASDLIEKAKLIDAFITGPAS